MCRRRDLAALVIVQSDGIEVTRKPERKGKENNHYKTEMRLSLRHKRMMFLRRSGLESHNEHRRLERPPILTCWGLLLNSPRLHSRDGKPRVADRRGLAPSGRVSGQ